MKNRDETPKAVKATPPKPTEQPKKLRLETLEKRIAPNAIWGD